MKWTEAQVDEGPQGIQYWIKRNGVKVHVYYSDYQGGWIARYDETFAFDTASEALREAEGHISGWDSRVY